MVVRAKHSGDPLRHHDRVGKLGERGEIHRRKGKTRAIAASRAWRPYRVRFEQPDPVRRPQARAARQLVLHGVRGQRGVRHHRGFDQRLAITRIARDVGPVNRRHPFRRRVHDEQQPIEDIAQGVVAGELEIALRREKDVDRRRHGAAAAVAQHDDELEALAQVIRRVLEAAHAFRAEPVAGHADDEEIVGSFVEDELDRNPRVGAAQHRGEGALARRAGPIAGEPEIARVDLDDPAGDATLPSHRLEQRGDRPAAFVEALARGVGVRRPRPRVARPRAVTVGDLDGLHAMMFTPPST